MAIVLEADMRARERYVDGGALATPGVCYVSFTLETDAEMRVVLAPNTSGTRMNTQPCVCVVLRPAGHTMGSTITDSNGAPKPLCASSDARAASRAGGSYFVYVHDEVVVVGVRSDAAAGAPSTHDALLCARGVSAARAVAHVGFASWDEAQTVMKLRVECGRLSVAAQKLHAPSLLRWNGVRMCMLPVGAQRAPATRDVRAGRNAALVAQCHTQWLGGAGFVCVSVLPHSEFVRLAAPDTVRSSYAIATETDVAVFAVCLDLLDAEVGGQRRDPGDYVVAVAWPGASVARAVLYTARRREDISTGASATMAAAGVLPVASVAGERGSVATIDVFADASGSLCVRDADWNGHARSGAVPAPGYRGPWTALTVWSEIVEPGLVVRLEHCVPTRIAPHYAQSATGGGNADVLDAQAAFAKAYEYACREVLLATGWHLQLAPLAARPGTMARVTLMGSEYNNPLHGDDPAHWHIATRGTTCDVTPHIYFVRGDPSGRLDAAASDLPRDGTRRWDLATFYASVCADGSFALAPKRAAAGAVSVAFVLRPTGHSTVHGPAGHTVSASLAVSVVRIADASAEPFGADRAVLQTHISSTAEHPWCSVTVQTDAGAGTLQVSTVPLCSGAPHRSELVRFEPASGRIVARDVTAHYAAEA